MPRVLRNTVAGVLSPQWVGLSGIPVEPDTGTVVAALTRLDGTVLPAPVVSPAEIRGQAGRYYAKLTQAHTSQLDIQTLVWTAEIGGDDVSQTQEVLIVGGMLVSPVRLYSEPDMSNKDPWLLNEVCEEINDLCEDYCNVAFAPRLSRETFNYTRSGSVAFRWAEVASLVLAVGDGINIANGLFDLRGSVLRTPSYGWPWRELVVSYQHGLAAPPPKLAREALGAARETVLTRATRSPRGTISEITGGTVVRYSTPNLAEGRPTGYLTLDPLLELERRPIGIA